MVILLHAGPMNIHTYVDVGAPARERGLPGGRSLSAWLRHDADFYPRTPRNGQQAAIAADIVALMDALGIEMAVIAGCDWGARTANIVAALWPERCKHWFGERHLIGSRETNKKPLPPKAELAWWYQFYFATERGRAATNSTGRTSRSSSGSRIAEMGFRRRHLQSKR